MKKRTVGILGLSGNPTHRGHIFIAELVHELLPLDEVWLMLSPHNPLKEKNGLAPTRDRLYLAHLAAQQSLGYNTWLKVSDFEVTLRESDHQNNTINFLQNFTAYHPDVQPVWLMGADSFATMHNWHGEWWRIMEDYPVVVVARAGNNEVALNSFVAKQFAAGRVLPLRFQAKPSTWCFLNAKMNMCSSTKVRGDLANGQSSDCLSADANAYIKQHKLYGYA